MPENHTKSFALEKTEQKNTHSLLFERVLTKFLGMDYSSRDSTMKDKRGVFKRVFVPVAVVSAIAIGSATYLSGINSFTEHKENVTNSLLNAARYLSQGAQSNPADAAKILREAVEKASKNPSFRITLLDGKGKILMDSDSTAKISEDESDQEEIKNAIKGEENVCLRTSGTMGKEVMYAAVPVFEKGRLFQKGRRGVRKYSLRFGAGHFRGFKEF